MGVDDDIPVMSKDITVPSAQQLEPKSSMSVDDSGSHIFTPHISICGGRNSHQKLT